MVFRFFMSEPCAHLVRPQLLKMVQNGCDLATIGGVLRQDTLHTGKSIDHDVKLLFGQFAMVILQSDTSLPFLRVLGFLSSAGAFGFLALLLFDQLAIRFKLREYGRFTLAVRVLLRSISVGALGFGLFLGVV